MLQYTILCIMAYMSNMNKKKNKIFQNLNYFSTSNDPVSIWRRHLWHHIKNHLHTLWNTVKNHMHRKKPLFTFILSFFLPLEDKNIILFFGHSHKIQPTHSSHCFFVQLVKQHLTSSVKVMCYRLFFYPYCSLYFTEHNNLEKSSILL